MLLFPTVRKSIFSDLILNNFRYSKLLPTVNLIKYNHWDTLQMPVSKSVVSSSCSQQATLDNFQKIQHCDTAQEEKIYRPFQA